MTSPALNADGSLAAPLPPGLTEDIWDDFYQREELSLIVEFTCELHELAGCTDASCAPPPVGTGGSHPGNGSNVRGQNGSRPESWEIDPFSEVDQIDKRLMEQTMTALAGLHGVSNDRLEGTTISVMGADHPSAAALAGASGGFLPSLPGTLIKARGTATEDVAVEHNRPWIFIRPGAGTAENLADLVHEYGHRTDAIKDADGYSAYTDQDTPAVSSFLTAAARSPTLRTQLENMQLDPKYAAYWGSRSEVWARSYAQWASTKIEGTAGDLVRTAFAMESIRGGWTWPDSEFETIAPFVEDVLRERGLL